MTNPIDLFRVCRIRRALWHKACAFGAIPPGARFVAFSSHNPYVKAHDRAVKLLEAVRQRINGDLAGMGMGDVSVTTWEGGAP